MKQKKEIQKIVIESNDLREDLHKILRAIDDCRDLAEEVGENQSHKKLVGFKAGKIYTLLEAAYDKLDEILDDKIPYIGKEEEDDTF